MQSHASFIPEDPTPPRARVEVVRDTHFGISVDDPYRWLEEWQSLETLAGAVFELFDLRMAGGRAFYLRRDPDADRARLVVCPGPDAPERVLVDPATMPGDGLFSIDWYVPSPDGRRVAYGIAQDGSEATTLHLLDVDTGSTLTDTISRVEFPFISWLDDRSFVYHRYPEPPADAPRRSALPGARRCAGKREHRVGYGGRAREPGGAGGRAGGGRCAVYARAGRRRELPAAGTAGGRARHGAATARRCVGRPSALPALPERTRRRSRRRSADTGSCAAQRSHRPADRAAWAIA